MGFRDMEVFNQALLAKQVWMILQVPSSLCARVLKEFYFDHGTILNATCPSGGSYTFRSILFGRDLLLEGLIWRVGDGSSIRIHHDNWIPRKGSLRPLGQVFMPGMTRVSDLLNEDATGWNYQKLEAMFTQGDIEDIVQICVAGPGIEDTLAWNFTKNGHFSVKSAYHLCMEKKRGREGQPGSSSSISTHNSWLALWGASASGKAIIHAWRLIRNGLAVGSELLRKKVKPGVFCPLADTKKHYTTCSGVVIIPCVSGRSWVRYWVRGWRSHLVRLAPRAHLHPGCFNGWRRPQKKTSPR